MFASMAGRDHAPVDSWVSTDHSPALSGRRSKDTEPEVILRRALHAAGGRFRLHPRLARGCTPDLVLPRRRLAVFVDGDYWHGCPVHFGDRHPSGPNAALWRAKFDATAARDARSTLIAVDAGWHVVRVWECEIRTDVASVVARIMSFLLRTHDRQDTRRKWP